MLKSLMSTGLAAALALSLAACGGGGKASEDVPTLRRGISAKVDTLDPNKSSAQWENIIIGDMFIGLTTDGPDGRPQMGMAESYEVSDDGLVWTFKLGDYQWSDGHPVTAQDFVYGFRRIQNPETASQYASLLWLVKNAEKVSSQQLPPEELGVKALDDKTLEITLEYPAPYLLGLLSHYTTFPIPSWAVEQYGDAWIQPENIVVNGPYKLVYWRTGDQLVSDKNPTGFGAAEACFDRVVYLELEDQVAIENKITAGELDINNSFDGTRYTELDEKLPGWVRTTPALIATYWTFNTKTAPFDDVRVRQALSMALDREFMVKNVLTTGYLPAYSFVPPGINNYDVDRPQVEWKDMPREQRLEEARRLLEEAGYGPNKPLEFEFIHRSSDDNPKVAPVAQANWSDIAPWVKPVIVKQDTKVLYARLRQKDFIFADGAWVADYDDPINFLYLLDSETGQQNYGDYTNTEYDALLDKSNTELDLKKRAEIFAEAEELMLNEYPITPMWFQVTKNLVDPTLTGWEENAKDNHRSRFLCRDGMQSAE
ncbi:peptide ABC transporter substrate-binding protein [Hyphomonas pacifica]|uniref:Peptide ABC transporter substrate-binding protein n=1 Tax=Hyphomonas pacifica TaxID=1280941 RepID=A0A062U3Y3_9PROT|nr:peptide ABC transporter substrate-binding protein [Hyphomonas pacifica]KCZ51319.1 peptide ABC transporter substrate-binding protein [Hyphomonas pacifica]RAN33981.1 peptide ABC transporter substrate-binding protein [Hyphomonas pacifica]RAN36602.1 peptide ABC transporter substrate-binding protein [Hyphomonas pacifica]